MYGMGALLALDEQKVRLKLLLRDMQLTLLEAVIGVISVRCSMNGVVCNFTSCAMLLCKYIATSIMTCVDFHCLNVWNGCRVGPGQTGCTFAAIAAWSAIDLTRSCY